MMLKSYFSVTLHLFCDFILFFIWENETLLFYLICCICLCIYYFGQFTVLLVSRPIPDFYAEIYDFYANIPCYIGFYSWYRAWYTVGGGGGYHVWLVGDCRLVHGVNQV